MFKLIGATTVGLLTLSTAAYFALRPKEIRVGDFETTKRVFNFGLNSLREYFRKLVQTPTVSQNNI